MGKMKNTYKTVLGKPEGKKPFGRHRNKWDGCSMHHMEIGWEGVDWIHLAQDRDQ
jgi:hypothetical protein